MKREMFLRPMRMTHRFGDAERASDPLGAHTFSMQVPKMGQLRTPPMTVQSHGERRYNEPMSAVDKFKGGRASINGPVGDTAGCVAAVVPASTKRRTSGK